MHDSSSSPDPLNDTYQSPNFQHQPRLKQTPSKNSCKKRKIFQLDVGNEISPQKIRVTVEAGGTRNNGGKRISCSPSRSTLKQKPKNTAGIGESSIASESKNYRGINATPKRGMGSLRKSYPAAANLKEVLRSRKKTSPGLSRDSDNFDPNETSQSPLTLGVQSTRKEAKKSQSSTRKLKRTPQAGSLPIDLLEDHNPLKELAKEIKKERSKYICPQRVDTQHHDHSGISPVQAGIIHGEVDKIENAVNTRPEIYANSFVKTNSSTNLSISSPCSDYVENDSHGFLLPSSHKENYYLSKSKLGGANYPSPESLENQISPESRRIPTRAYRALTDQDIILNSGYQHDENWMTQNKIKELQKPVCATESDEFSMDSGDSVHSLNHVRDSTTQNISHSKVKIPIKQVYSQRKPSTSTQEVIGARKYAGNDTSVQDLSLKEPDNSYEREIEEEEEEDFDLLLETLNSPSSIRSKYQEMHGETAQRSRKQKPASPCHANSEESSRKNPGLVFSNTKIINPEVDNLKNESTIDLVATIEQREDSNLQSGELHNCQIPKKVNFDPSTWKKDGSNQNKSDFPKITDGCNGFSAIHQKPGLSPASDLVLSSPPIPSSSISNTSQSPIISSSNTTNTSSKIYDTLNNNKLPPPSHNTKAIPSLQTISYDRGKPNPNDYVYAWAKSLDHSLKGPQQNRPLKKTPPNSPTKSCLRSPRKASTSPDPLGTPIKAVTFVSTPPIPSSPLCNSLSGSIWTKRHWSLLDQIVQSWKPEGLTGWRNNQKQESSRNTTRVISQLLGKYVFSAKGERMKLEQWHLDAVDEFRGLIPGWEERHISMRVFALLLGERIRSEERVTKERSLE